MSRARIRCVFPILLCLIGLSAGPASAVVPAAVANAGAPVEAGPLPTRPVKPPVVAPLPLPPRPLVFERPRTGVEPVDRIAQPVQGRAGSPDPAPAQPRTSSSTGQAQIATDAPADTQPADQTAADPSGASRAQRSELGDPQQAASAADEPVSRAEPPSDAKTQADTATQSAERAGDSQPGATSENEQAGAQAERPAPTVIERIVGVVPWPLKIALGFLLVALIVAVAGAWRTKRRLDLAERRAATDVLTGLPNRRHADEVIERLLAAARRNKRSLAVVLFDLDHFKAVNDRFGHSTGDDALRAAANTTRELLRGSDHVARFGGEEFILLLPETAAGDAAIVAEKLRSRIADLQVAGLDGGITASFGIAVYPDHGIGADELIKEADAALYQAKQNGRNRVELSAGDQLELVATAALRAA